MSKWTTTPERAREVVARCLSEPRNLAASDEAAFVMHQEGYRLYSAPSLHSAIVAARALSEKGAVAEKRATRILGPEHLNRVISGDLNPVEGDVWTRSYIRSIAKQQADHPTPYFSYGVWGSYYMAYLEVAIDGGYKPSESMNLQRAPHICGVIGCGTAIVAVDSPTFCAPVNGSPGSLIIWADGTGLAYVNGIYRREVLESPEKLSIKEIDDIKNEDLRSWIIANYAGVGTNSNSGWIRYLSESGAEVLDERHNDITNTHEALMKSNIGAVKLVCTCPTRRLFALSVPPEIKTCAEAQLWIHRGIDISART